MGNCNCFGYVKPQMEMAMIIDVQGNTRQVEVPVSAAEIMLEEAGRVVCPVDEIRRSGRIVGMKAEGELLAGRVYMLVVASRVNSKVSKSEMGLIDWVGQKRRGGAKVLPAVTEAEKVEHGDWADSGCSLGNCRRWRPVLEPISEAI